MNVWRAGLHVVLLAAALLCFAAAVRGIFRLGRGLPRLHALAAADGAGMLCLVLALVVRPDGTLPAARLLLVWVAFVAASALNTHLLGRAVQRGELD